MPVQIAEAVLEVERRAADGESIEAIAAELGISASSYHRWRSLYHGLNADDIAYTKRLESEVKRLQNVINEFEMYAPLPEEPRARALG
ncbi:MAG: transposase [Terricaulis sp.]